MKIFIEVTLICIAFSFANAASKVISQDILSKEDVKALLYDVGILCSSGLPCNPPITAENTRIAEMNEFFDKLFVNVDDLIVRVGLEPAKLPDIHYDGREDNVTLVMNLTEGIIHSISSLHREGDAFLFFTEGSEVLQLRLPIALNKLNFEFNYGVSGSDLRRHGKVTGNLNLITLLVTISFDLKTYVATLDNVERTNAGSISLSFSGHVLTDWLLNLASEIAVPYVQDDIWNLVETIVRKPCQILVNLINRVTSNL